jgi:hypothetical protein
MFRKELSSSRHWYFYPSRFLDKVLKSIQDTIIMLVVWLMFYDHFLAKIGDVFQWKFKRLCYCFLRIFERKHSHFKWKTVMLMPMIDQNWLLSYQTIEGINILTQMDGRTKNKSKMRLLQRNSGSYTLNLRRTYRFLWRFESACETKLIEE